MTKETLRIATRKSPLALWQAEFVAQRLRQAYPGLRVELLGISTKGDKILDSPLAKLGGKGLFVKELEHSLLEGRADIAVHSMKDVPVELPRGLSLPVIMARDDPRDAFISSRYSHPEQLPAGACVGTSSLRRRCQLAACYPAVEIHSLRGNINTRLARLDSGEFDAIILAAVGLKRLKLAARIACYLEPEVSLPAIGQGAIGIECREEDVETREQISLLEDPATHLCVKAERAMNARLQGGCQVPIAGYAVLEGEQLLLRGLVGDPDGSKIVAAEIRGPANQAEYLGVTLAEELLARGADSILRRIYNTTPTGPST